MKIEGTRPDWSELHGAYRRPYDPRRAIAVLQQDATNREAWTELWNELHHQGDVGEASYAALPLFVEACRSGLRDWNFFGLIATIETERHRLTNPVLPTWLDGAYADALREAKRMAVEDLTTATDPLLIRTAVAVVALASGQRELGALLAHAETSEVREVLEGWLAWSTLYRDGTS